MIFYFLTEYLYILSEREELRIIPKHMVWITGRMELTFPEVSLQENTKSSVFSIVVGYFHFKKQVELFGKAIEHRSPEISI